MKIVLHCFHFELYPSLYFRRESKTQSSSVLITITGFILFPYRVDAIIIASWTTTVEIKMLPIQTLKSATPSFKDGIVSLVVREIDYCKSVLRGTTVVELPSEAG